VIIATYGTLRADVGAFAQLSFETVVLDEAQASRATWIEAHRARRLQADAPRSDHGEAASDCDGPSKLRTTPAAPGVRGRFDEAPLSLDTLVRPRAEWRPWWSIASEWLGS
jgi:hypothetical protein